MARLALKGGLRCSDATGCRRVDSIDHWSDGLRCKVKSEENRGAGSDPLEGPEGDALIPVRMLNEFTYCPRLFHLMHVEGRWEDNVFTLEGKAAHRKVDQIDHVLPDAACADQASEQPGDTSSGAGTDGDEPPVISTSVSLDSLPPPLGLGLTAKLDLVSTDGDEAVPVERKRGRVPDIPERCYEPERVQLMAQGILLRAHGYRCDHGILYFVGSRTKVTVPFTDALESQTRALLDQARRAATATVRPPPLDDSPKCNGCSLAGICLPDETLALMHVPEDPGAPNIRRLYPARSDSLPLYVQEQGASVCKQGNVLVIKKRKEVLAQARLHDVSQVVLCGNVSITAQTVHLLCESGIPVLHLSRGGWFYGFTQGITLRNAFARAAQYSVTNDSTRRLSLAKAIVMAKGTNCRTLLKRNATPEPQKVLSSMTQYLERIPRVDSVDTLLGMEGALAREYFSAFAGMLRPRDISTEWDFTSRNRRPPRDPVNCLLSFAYSLLAKECTTALLGEGLDPWWGVYHQPRHGRPSLALDLMEELRPLIADSAVITALNTGMVTASDFTCSKAGCLLAPGGRKGLIRAFEARLDHMVTHPLFDYRCSWRAMIRVQSRLLSQWLSGELKTYQGITTR